MRQSSKDLHDEEVNSAESFDLLSNEQKSALCLWIETNFFARKTPNYKHTSYELKELFERDGVGFHITNGQFKGAMVKSGFDPVDSEEINWCFCISEKSPALKKRLFKA